MAAAAAVCSDAPAMEDVRAEAKPNLFRAALARFPSVKDASGNILTDGFLDICTLTLPAIDSFGAAFVMVRSDIATNVQRIRHRQASDPARFRLLQEVVLDEVERGEDSHLQSCTKAVLWLKRGMEFMLAIMGALLEDPDATLPAVVNDKYYHTIHRWHGFLCSSAFSMAFTFVPTREAFLERLGGGAFDKAAAVDMEAYVAKFSALLAEIHLGIIDKHGLDDPRRV